MSKHENIFYLRLHQQNNPQLIKDYIQTLCDKLIDKQIEFHLDLYLDNMFRDEVYDGGRGKGTTYPYVKFEKTLDDMTNYLSFDMDNLRSLKPDISLPSGPDISLPSGINLQNTTLFSDKNNTEQPEIMSTCSELLAKIPDDIQNETVFELKIYTSTPQIYCNGGIAQLEYLLKKI